MILTIPGEPIAWARRVVTKSGHTFMPTRTTEWKHKVALEAKAQGCELIDGPVSMSLWFLFPSQNPPRKRTPRPAAPKPTKPDIDNLIKAVADALNGIAYLDDAQIVRCQAWKIRAPQGEPPRTVVRIEPMESKRDIYLPDTGMMVRCE